MARLHTFSRILAPLLLAGLAASWALGELLVRPPASAVPALLRAAIGPP